MGCISCPMCGAAAATDATACAFCRVRLATVSCPSCFGLVFVGSRHCAHCGARAERAAVRDAAARRCPRGCQALRSIALGGADLGECERCGGVWVDQATFQRLCTDRERQAVMLDVAPPRPGMAAVVDTVRYSPCPECRKLMNRVNFARASGVVVDSCKEHGVWFDEDELRRVVEFIRAGGVDMARARERDALAEERRLLQLRQAIGASHSSPRQSASGRESRATGVLASFLSLLVS